MPDRYGCLAQEIRVNWAFQRENREEPAGHQIFVGDLAPDVNDISLFEAFRNAYGAACLDGRVMMDSNTGRHKGYGFVTFR